MPDRVRITDVSPRDGLQNEPGFVPTADKIRLVEFLCRTGVDEIEVTSFVSPKWVPQLGDARALLASVASLDLTTTSVMFSALVPNERGLDDLEQSRATTTLEKIAVFTAASETFCQKNINSSIAQSLERFAPIVRRAHSDCKSHLRVRGYLSCAIACPFEGPIDPHVVADVAFRLIELGVEELDLGDTIGAGTPETVSELLRIVLRRISFNWSPPVPVTLHLHDTYGHAADCVRAALDIGVRSFDGSVAGLGGCPYASKKLPDGSTQRAPGNISTETLVRTIHQAGYQTSVNLDALEEAAIFARQIVTRARTSSPKSEI